MEAVVAGIEKALICDLNFTIIEPIGSKDVVKKGALELLEGCLERRIPVVLSSDTSSVECIIGDLEELERDTGINLIRYFAKIYSAKDHIVIESDESYYKDLAYICRNMRVSKRNIVMLGNKGIDEYSARRAGIRFIPTAYLQEIDYVAVLNQLDNLSYSLKPNF